MMKRNLMRVAVTATAATTAVMVVEQSTAAAITKEEVLMGWASFVFHLGVAAAGGVFG